jgi:hypothetical protein
MAAASAPVAPTAPAVDGVDGLLDAVTAIKAQQKQLEQRLKAAKENAIQQGSATEKRGKPFWTIRPPKTQDQPF